MRFLRAAAAGLAVLAALAGAWILGGNALAARRERSVDRAFEDTFGPRAALEAKYAVASPNAEALKAEELARAVGFDLRPRKFRVTASSSTVPEAERAASGDYVKEQVARPTMPSSRRLRPPRPSLRRAASRSRRSRIRLRPGRRRAGPSILTRTTRSGSYRTLLGTSRLSGS